MKIIGRKTEQSLLKEYANSNEPEFVAVYGRRRVGKTYLVNESFGNNFNFSVTGLARGKKVDQLKNFNAALTKYGAKFEVTPDNWFDAFEALIAYLEKTIKKGKKCTVFIDELPWFDTKKSGFITALEHFWNGWAASKPEILLIVCGSATSWMMNNLIRNKGGLHDRVTRRMRLQPFTLTETSEYLKYKGIVIEQIDIATAYMVFGGIPFYLNQFRPELSTAQNIDALCFTKDAFMYDEFATLFDSLFKNSAKHVQILEALSTKKKGMTRSEIIDAANLQTGGGITAILDELEQCGFIEKYNDYSGLSGRYVYQLMDFFTLFYLKFMKHNKKLGSGYWINTIGSGAYHAWAGQTFEKLCLVHVEAIKQKLGISGILAVPFAWQGTNGVKGAQIDLLIDRADNIINICECKFVKNQFEIDKSYSENLRNKTAAFARVSKTKKALHLTMITTYGVKQNKYAGMVQSQVLLEDLFQKMG
jgi:AAA+ ATPase superfamily predicted ATPase